jgi:hypothetical protein
MRWKKWNEPKVGDKRYVKYFALFPTTLTNDHVVWLESYHCLEEFNMQGKDWDTAYWKVVKSWFIDENEPILD